MILLGFKNLEIQNHFKFGVYVERYKVKIENYRKFMNSLENFELVFIRIFNRI